MDAQMMFNVLVGLSGFLGGWILNNISRSIDRLDRDVRQLPHTYVTKADYRDDVQHIRRTLDDIFNIINQLHTTKADK